MSVTIVTQTTVRPEHTGGYLRWQEATSAIVATYPGFIEQKVTPPSPPTQVDWVIQQRFASSEAAVAWLHSDQRSQLVIDAAAMLLGRDDVHLVEDDGIGVLPSPVSVVISTRVRAGQESNYRRWEQRMAAAQAQAPGFQGYRFEPPVPGVQDDFLAILRFDSEANLQRWLDSPERQRLLQDGQAFTEEFHTRVARTGFEQWFTQGSPGVSPPAAWKQNMVVMLILYPVVNLISVFVQIPLLLGKLALPPPVALFIACGLSVPPVALLVPWASRYFDWWLRSASSRTSLFGVLLILALYALTVITYWQIFSRWTVSY